jgi:DNA-directed RNA polymerase specialized sigma24 family protein
VSRSGHPRNLSPNDFQALLNRLGGLEQGGFEYEHLRRKLIRFFTWERCPDPEWLADGCLDRVARKLGENQEIRDLKAYVAAVARLMVKEEHARLRREQNPDVDQLAVAAPSPSDEDLDGDLATLNCCLERFSPDQRRLILRYYEGDHAQRIENRKRLAEELGMASGALRNRAMRLREILEACIAKRLGQRDRSPFRATKDRGVTP